MKNIQSSSDSNINTINMAIHALNSQEFISVFNKILLIHPEIKNIYFGIDFLNFNKKGFGKTNISKNILDEEKNIKICEIGSVLFSLKALNDSVLCLIRNVCGKKRNMYYSNGTKVFSVNNRVERDFTSTLDYANRIHRDYEMNMQVFDIIKELISKCSEKNINITFFIMPSHILDLYTIYTNCQNDYEKWKIKLVQITDVYDFQYPSQYVEENVSPNMKYFFESSHSTYLLGNIILDVLMGKNKEFGHLLTKDNVETQVIKDRNELVKFFKNNKSFDKFIKIDKEQIK